jgi:hypothetical protein
VSPAAPSTAEDRTLSSTFDKPRSALQQRLGGEVLAVEVQQVEGVEHYLMAGVGTPMLERLERRSAL